MFPNWITLESVNFFFNDSPENISFPQWAGFHYTMRLYSSIIPDKAMNLTQFK